MVTFAGFLEKAAARPEFVNVLFEECVFELGGTLRKLTFAFIAVGEDWSAARIGRRACRSSAH
jgi:hypothetical protein